MVSSIPYVITTNQVADILPMARPRGTLMNFINKLSMGDISKPACRSVVWTKRDFELYVLVDNGTNAKIK